MRLTILVLAAAAAGLAGGARAQDAFDVEEAASVCASCHGDDGVPIEADYPVIWGQQFYYIYVQLKDYNSGLRANDIMAPQVADFDRDQMKALATYFSQKAWPKIVPEKDDAKSTAGEAVTSSGECSACHNTYMGDSRVPRVAGQQEAYLARTLLEFKHEVRNNAPAMGSLMRTFSDDDIEAVALYLATRGQ